MVPTQKYKCWMNEWMRPTTYMAYKVPTDRIRRTKLFCLVSTCKWWLLLAMCVSHHECTSPSWAGPHLHSQGSLCFRDYLRCPSPFYFTSGTGARTMYSKCSFVQLLRWVRFNFKFCHRLLLHEHSPDPIFFNSLFQCTMSVGSSYKEHQPLARLLSWFIKYHQKPTSARILD